MGDVFGSTGPAPRHRGTEDAIEQIRELVASGAWGAGTRLPREVDLAKQLGLSRNLFERRCGPSHRRESSRCGRATGRTSRASIRASCSNGLALP
jgi:DNA-binding transcriptional MocR family regulator